MGTLLQTDIAGPKMPARNAQKEKEVLQWVEGVMGEPLPAGDFGEVLKDGVVLCKLINKIQPGSVKKFKEKGPDLFEGRNLPQVALCLFSLARATQNHPEFSGPSLGPKTATKNERNFTDEQIR